MNEEQQSSDQEPEATRRRRGCIRPVVWTLLIGTAVMLLLAVGLWWYTGTTSFAALVARRVEATLEFRMNRNVVIESVEIQRGRVTSVILKNVRIANAEGASEPWMVIIPRLVLEGGVESFRQRVVRVGVVEVHDPQFFVEIFPEGFPLAHNLPGWRRGEPRRFEIARVETNQIRVRGGDFHYLDHRRDIRASLRQVNANVDPNVREGLYKGVVLAEAGSFRFQDWKPIDLRLRSGFSFADRVLQLRGTRVRGNQLSLDLAGAIVTEGEVGYDLTIDGTVGLERLAEVMRLEQELAGSLVLDTVLAGTGGRFSLTGGVSSPSVTAAGYSLEALRASIDISESEASVDIASAEYGGGTVSGTWTMATYDAPRPMAVNLRYRSVSLEALLADWNVEASGLRGAMDGSLRYEFVQKDLLGGSGSATAVLRPGAVAFGDAPYPMPVSGRTDVEIRRGVLRFQDQSLLRLPSTVVRFDGTLVLENLDADLSYRVESEDFTVLDKVAVNFGRSFGASDFDRLGLAGTGTITGNIGGTMGEPVVSASIDARNARYNDVPIGTARVNLTWTGATDTLRFERARFARGDATLQMSGTIRFPEGGGPVFDLAMDAERWPVEEALALVELDFEATGLATGSLTVRGTPDRGTVRFADLLIRQDDARLTLNGAVDWLPGEGNVAFDLDIVADSFRVSEIKPFIDIELTGLATGRLTVKGTTDRGTVRFDDLLIRQNGARLTLNGAVDWLPGEGNLAFNLDIAAESYPVSEIAAFLDMADLPIQGAITGTLHLEGPIDSLEGAGLVTLRDGSIGGEPIQEAVADLRFDQGSLNVRHFEVTAPAGVLTGEASYDFETKEFTYLIQPSTIDLAQVELLRGLEGIVGGTLQITSSGAGTAEDPELVIEARLVNGSILGSPIPEDAEQPQFYLAVRDGNLVIRGSALDTLTIVGEGRITEGGAISGDVNVEIDDLQRLVQVINPASTLQLQGAVTADLDLGGSITSLETLEIDGTITRLDLEVGGERIQALDPIQFALSDGQVVLDAVTLRSRDTDFFIDGTVSLVGDRQIALTLRGNLDMALVQLLVPESTANGTLALQTEIGGTLSSPRLRGTAELRDASLRLPGFPQLISDIYASLILQGDRVEIDAFRATLGGGRIVAGGFVTLQGLRPARIRINAQGEDVTLRYYEGVTLTGDVDLLLSGDLERLSLQGSLNVDRAVYYEEFDLTQLILQRVLERQAVVPRVAATWQDKVDLRIDVIANETLAISNNVAEMSGSADLDVTGTLANPIILGRVTIDEGGTFEFQDVNYRVVQGTISFQNPFRNDPYFDITAEGILKSRGQTLGEIEEYELTVNLTGTLDRITPNISSDPPIGDLTLLSLLSGGVGTAGGSQLFGGQSVSQAGTALLLSQVGEAIGTRIIPFADAVRVDTVGASGFNPTVTLEKQISRDVFVIVIYDTASTENVEIIQWQATNNWVIQFTRDSEKADTYIINAIDARFRKRYEGRW